MRLEPVAPVATGVVAGAGAAVEAVGAPGAAEGAAGALPLPDVSLADSNFLGTELVQASALGVAAKSYKNLPA